MNVPIKSKNDVAIPPSGYVFAFIDSNDMQLKAKLSDGTVVNYTSIDDDNLKVLSLADYTAFEVYAHSEDIPVGYSEELRGNVNKAIPACMEHRFDIKTTVTDTSKSDVIIDWGDGETSSVSKGEFLKTSLNEEDGELNIQFSHKYKDSGKYIVKIFGKKYYTFNWPDSTVQEERWHYNLLCRIFDTDLPLCSCVTNLASAGSYARRLKKVRIPSYYNFSNVSNFSYLFYASGVESVTGLKNMIGVCGTDSNMFDNCTSLKETDFMFPVLSTRGTWAKMFNSCKELATPVSSMFFAGGLSGTQINVNNLFNGCVKLPAEDLGDILWNRKNVTWINTENAFTGCSNELRALVPVSWGGTNSSIEANKYITDWNDYTAFEVYPTDETIPAGTLDEVTGFTYSYEVPPQMTAKFNIRTTAKIEDLDVVVDWGDGFKQVLKNGEYEKVSASGYTYTMSHTYSLSGRYIVKIYGHQYFALSTSSFTENSLVSRCLDSDLPIASHLTNLSSLCSNSKRLLKVDVPFSKIMFRIINTASAFARCYNLVQATGFGGYMSPAMFSCSWMFNDCWSLKECDFILPSYFTDAWGIKGTFTNCKSLAVDINSLIPPQGFHVKKPEKTQLFMNVPLTGTVPADFLFNDKSLNWTGEANTFYGCPSEIRSQVPVSWGGTADDSIIEPSLEERIKALEEAMSNTLALDK